jgi:putative acetyltransferase
MDIRPETPADASAVRAVNEAAFPTGVEADLVERIRASPGYVADLTLVAVVQPADPSSAGMAPATDAPHIVGHLMLSRITIGGSDEPVLALAPMAVRPDWQRRGVGSALVRAALDAAEAREELLVVVLGHPWFYPRFGFKPASRYGIFPSEPWSDAAFMAKPLARWGRDVRGRVHYPSTFDGV